jgi:hypothetical protein
MKVKPPGQLPLSLLFTTKKEEEALKKKTLVNTLFSSL